LKGNAVTPLDLRMWSEFIPAGGNTTEAAFVDQITIDTRTISSPNSLFVALPGKNCDGHSFLQHAAAMGSRYAIVDKRRHFNKTFGQMSLLYVENPLRSLQELATIYRQQCRALIIGITGSYGKTMLKDLLSTLLRRHTATAASPESFNSQIGVPLSLFTIQENDSLAIIEAGISQSGEMEHLAKMISPDFAILTNIGKAHLSTLKTLEETALEKSQLFTNLPAENWALIPSDKILRPFFNSSSAKQYFWDKKSNSLPHVRLDRSVKNPEHITYRIDFPDGKSVKKSVSHETFYYADLVNMAIKASSLLGVSSDIICNILKNYTPEPMRTETWKTPSGATVINETYCSHTLSLNHSLKVLENSSKKGRKFFVFGGLRESSRKIPEKYEQIGKRIAQANIDQLTLVGDDNFSPLMKEVTKSSANTRVHVCSTATEAIRQLKEEIRMGDTVLIKGSSKEPWEQISESLSGGKSNNRLTVNFAAIQSNIDTIRSRLPVDTKFMAMVKAQGYGTDSVLLAKFLISCNVDILGVANVDEAIALRDAGITQAIFVINAAPYEAEKIARYNLEVGVSNIAFAETLNREGKLHDKIIKVHLHVDTGMSRFGCRPEESLPLAKTIHNLPFLCLHGIMTHFACAERPEEDCFTYAQAKTLSEIITSFSAVGIAPPYKHAMNSSAAIRFKFLQFNMVRIGLSLFGIHPSAATAKILELRPALTLTSKIVGLNTCKEGESISYGKTYTVKRERELIAVLPLGYFDGLHQRYSGKGILRIRGYPAPMVGTICMDFMMVDVTHIPDIHIGEEVLIFGEDNNGYVIPAESVASNADSNVYELITCLGPRIQRVFINEEKLSHHERKGEVHDLNHTKLVSEQSGPIY
jgi:alanine racemase